MSGLRSDENIEHGASAIRDAARIDKLLSSGIRLGSLAGLFNALETGGQRALVDKARGVVPVTRGTQFAASAALHSYWSIYGDEIGGGTRALLAALYQFWIRRFREGYPIPKWLEPAQDEEAAAPREDSGTLARALEALENYGR